jgi:hypothetical protein
VTSLSEQPLQQLTVVIAGGDSDTRDWLLTTLRGAGHIAQHHPDGPDAVAWLHRNQADLLIACIGEEALPAAELVEQAQRIHPTIGVLYVADPHQEGLPWAEVPPGGVLLYGPTGPDLLPAIAVALTRVRRGS